MSCSECVSVRVPAHVCAFLLCSVPLDSLPFSESVNRASVRQVMHRRRVLSHGSGVRDQPPKVAPGRGEVTPESRDHLARHSDGSCLVFFSDSALESFIGERQPTAAMQRNHRHTRQHTNTHTHTCPFGES